MSSRHHALSTPTIEFLVGNFRCHIKRHFIGLFITFAIFRIHDHQRQAAADAAAAKAEGQEIRRLAEEAVMGAKKRHDDMLVQMKLTRKDLLEDIEVRRRMRWADQIREEVNPVPVKNGDYIGTTTYTCYLHLWNYALSARLIKVTL